MTAPPTAGAPAPRSPDRIGGLAWARRTQGALSDSERRELLGRIAAAQQAALAAAAGAADGAGRRVAPLVDATELQPPDSRLAREAEREARETLSPLLLDHSYRTWVFGTALAALDGATVDGELLYVGSLLHDVGLDRATPARCFTLDGADAAQRVAARASGSGDVVADAICAHITPGVSVESDGAIASYIQAGSMADFAGLRTDELAETLRATAGARFPEHGGGGAIIGLLGAQAEAVPDGRIALYFNALAAPA